jgi:hypothetical protein
MIFNIKHGDLGLFILPLAFLSFFGTLYLVLMGYYGLVSLFVREAIKFHTIGFHPAWSSFRFSWFFFNTHAISFVNVLLLSLTLFIIFMGKRLAGAKDQRYMDVVYSLFLYSFIAPLWLVKALYNTALSKRTTWR